jgi:hypothetical protein
MHDSVKFRLEEYLRSGVPTPEMEHHLRNCGNFRGELDAMRAQAILLRTLKPPVDMEPGGNFYARVMTRIENQARPSVWSLFGESSFAQRLVYASATFLVLLCSYMISSHSEADLADDGPEVILAGQQIPEPVTMDPQRDREVILANLATWGGGGDRLQDYQ